MRGVIQKILKESIENKPVVANRVYLIMHKSGKLVLSKQLPVRWVDFESYGHGDYEELNYLCHKSETQASQFLKLTIYCFEKNEPLCGYNIKEDLRNKFIPKDWEVVEYMLGLTPAEFNEGFN